MTDGGQGRVVRVGMVDDHRAPVWGIERILQDHDDLQFVSSGMHCW